MKRFFAVIAFIFLCFCMTACSPSENSSGTDDSYLNGIEQGYKDVFLNLWQSSTLVSIIDDDTPWETDKFTLSLALGKDGWGRNVRFHLETHTRTMEDCFKNKKMLFNVFTHNGEQFDPLLTDDLFYMYALVEEGAANKAKATVGIYDSVESLAILISIDNQIYTAVYYIPD